MMPLQREDEAKFQILQSASRAFTFIELLIAIVIIVIITTIGSTGFKFYRSKAYEITVRHDLESFAKAEEVYRALYNVYLGAAGDFLDGGPPRSGTLDAAALLFSPSPGVRIEIVSGDGQHPNDSAPLKVRASHPEVKKKFVYNFFTQKTTEEGI
jgi:prepilin-type N-terminal cleavage/methylation domain-containing protein